MTDAPDTAPCCWCQRIAHVYDRKADGYVWFECEAGHLSLWSPITRTTLWEDDPRREAAS